MTLRFSDSLTSSIEQSYTLTRSILAIPILSTDSGDFRLGPITQLPEGAQLETYGAGFDEQTVRIRSEGRFYYVFVDDLEPKRKRAVSAAGS
jgi:hypothetical protein